ncbi:tyrosine-type recombinase/integrase [Altererythrobacter sp. CC-YST694]|uniref:tyrosine-type recombinase/integrase n=1 Tax=Altererythrobacter sp. CC-YST694 TaxID=2755038 RepID=UPI001D00A3C6|nr:integrase arm-type DNA-binding domain-containing protein [Altererythrobacter sp. CC-YST694]MCB5426325.1 tyrosine-type recombinase/integrase [Altererythrobacter sp. CC-YST694]
MKLTDAPFRNAKPREKPYKLSDSGGLFLLVQPTGGKFWRLKYRIHGKEKKLALGAYPETGLAKARELRDAAKAELAAGKDPSREKKLAKARQKQQASHTFAAVAADYFDKRNNDGNKAWAKGTAAKNDWLYRQLAPALGNVPVAEIEPLEVLQACQKIEARGNRETAMRAMQLASSIFRYAVATARLRSDPTRDLKGALRTPKTKHHAAILEPLKLGQLLRAIDGYSGHYGTKFALELAPHVFLRPGELRQARWSEIDLDEGVWMIPAERAKMRRPHHAPLSRQVREMLQGLRALTVRQDGFVFPSIRSHTRPMSENTLNAALRRLGYTSEEVTTHGFRATASTLLNQARDPETGRSLWSADAIEKALAHGGDDKVRRAYHRGDHWDERVEMAQWWSDYLDQLRKGADIMKFPDREAG